MRHIAGSTVGLGVAAGLGLGVLISADWAVGSEGAGAGVPGGVVRGDGGGVSSPGDALAVAVGCGFAETDSVGVALASTLATGTFAC
jgi:hypothetical protein